MDVAVENRVLIGKRIRELREARGFYQEAFSKMIGSKRTAVSNYENGVSAPQPYMLVKIAEVLGTTVDYLVGATDVSLPSNLTSQNNRTLELTHANGYLFTIDGKELSQEELKLITAFIRTTRKD